MGILNLIFGIIGIVFAVYFVINAIFLTGFLSVAFIAYTGVAVAAGSIGASLITKFDIDRKKI